MGHDRVILDLNVCNVSHSMCFIPKLFEEKGRTMHNTHVDVFEPKGGQRARAADI